MAQTFNAPRPEDIVGVSTLVVGVGPGGNTSMLAYVTRKPSCFCHAPLIFSPEAVWPWWTTGATVY